MKYVAHMTCAFQDEKIQAAVAAGGIKAYAVYWILIEAIAAQIRPESISVELTLTWAQWAGRMGIDPRNARRMTTILHETSVILLQDHGKHATIKIPNILKYADEYTKKVCKKSGQTPDISRDNIPRLSGSPALPALPTKEKGLKDLPQPVDNFSPPATDGANDGGNAEGHPPVAPTLSVDPEVVKLGEIIKRRQAEGIPH